MSNESQNSLVKGQPSQCMPQQGIQISPELQQQISVLNARITNVNLAHADLLKEIDTTFKALISTIIALQKENGEMKAKNVDSPTDIKSN